MLGRAQGRVRGGGDTPLTFLVCHFPAKIGDWLTKRTKMSPKKNNAEVQLDMFKTLALFNGSFSAHYNAPTYYAELNLVDEDNIVKGCLD